MRVPTLINWVGVNRLQYYGTQKETVQIERELIWFYHIFFRNNFALCLPYSHIYLFIYLFNFRRA